jgi:hypothetical protein
MFISSDRRSGDKVLKLNNWSLCFRNINVIIFQTKIEITAQLCVSSVPPLSGLISHNPSKFNVFR